VSVPGAFCADGSTTGIGVNTSKGSDKLLIYLEGGGACWDFNTCFILQTASNLTGYGQAEFGAAEFGNGLFARDDPGNPFKGDNFVYLPYCTGDVHSGNRMTSYSSDAGTQTLHHVGYTNVQADLVFLQKTFTGVKRLTLAGTSAGGYGALFNYTQVKAAFPSAGAYLVADGSPPLRPPYFTNAWYQAQAEAWGNVQNLPPGCGDCSPFSHGGGMFYAIPFFAEDQAFRASLLGSSEDLVISYFGSLPPGNPNDLCLGAFACAYAPGLVDLIDNVIRPAGPGKMRVYVVDGGVHGLLGDMSTVSQDGVQLESFLAAQLGVGEVWRDVGP
jgi:hypothetical protein